MIIWHKRIKENSKNHCNLKSWESVLSVWNDELGGGGGDKTTTKKKRRDRMSVVRCGSVVSYHRIFHFDSESIPNSANKTVQTDWIFQILLHKIQKDAHGLSWTLAEGSEQEGAKTNKQTKTTDMLRAYFQFIKGCSIPSSAQKRYFTIDSKEKWTPPVYTAQRTRQRFAKQSSGSTGKLNSALRQVTSSISYGLKTKKCKSTALKCHAVNFSFLGNAHAEVHFWWPKKQNKTQC